MARTKKDLDKDALYKKLMPTADLNSMPNNKKQTTTIPKGSSIVLEKFVEKEFDDNYKPDVNWVKTDFVEKAKPNNNQINQSTTVSTINSAPAFSNLQQGKIGNSLNNNTKNNINKKTKKEDLLVVHNVIENLVIKSINEIAPQCGCCTCEVCLNDTAALALNKLPTHYIVASKDDIQQKTQDFLNSTDIDVTGAVIEALAMIKQNPRHN